MVDAVLHFLLIYQGKKCFCFQLFFSAEIKKYQIILSGVMIVFVM